MTEPLYVPVLPTRSHAVTTYQGLPWDVLPHTAPLWTLPHRADRSRKELKAAVSADLDKVGKAYDKIGSLRSDAGWVDAPFADETQLTALAEVLEHVTASGSLRPVTGPERSEEQQRWARAVAQRAGEGVGVRVLVHGAWDGSVAERLCRLLERTESAVRADRMDLLLDLAGIHEDRPDVAKQALRALDELVPLMPWRTIAPIGGGVTQPEEDEFLDDLFREPRREWRAWQAITGSGRPYAASLTYGDYGVQPADFVARKSSWDQKDASWGVLRYTVEDAYVAAKMMRGGPNPVARNRKTLKRLLRLPGFREPTKESAEEWLHDTAWEKRLRKDGWPAKTGNFHDWLTVGNGQHMTYVVRTLGG